MWLPDLKSLFFFSQTNLCFLLVTIVHTMTFFFRKFVRSKLGFTAASSPSFSPTSVPEQLLFLPPSRYSRANWKASVIILVLAQIWWDQRWPAGCGRGADGCMLRGDQAKALQVLTPPLPWVPRVGGIRLGEPT